MKARRKKRGINRNEQLFLDFFLAYFSINIICVTVKTDPMVILIINNINTNKCLHIISTTIMIKDFLIKKI
jgi:hypothetical protein